MTDQDKTPRGIHRSSNDGSRPQSTPSTVPGWSNELGFLLRTLPGFHEGAPKRNVIVLLVYLLVGLVILSLLREAIIGSLGNVTEWFAGASDPKMLIENSKKI